MINSVFYLDKNRAETWIDRDWTERIADRLRQEKIEEKDAVGLRDWLSQTIKDSNSYKSVIVFPQDMVPDTVMRSNSPNALIRRFLDEGGNIVWIGHHPFWDMSVSRKETDREQVWQGGLHYAMLGVEMLIAESSSKSEWVPKWRDRMNFSWYSMRPIIVESQKSSSLDSEMFVEPLAFTNVTLLPSSWNALALTRWKKAGTKVGSFGLTIAGFGGNATMTDSYPKELSFERMKLACAWHISFNKKYRRRGFFRIFDCGSFERDPPKALIDDIVLLATT